MHVSQSSPPSRIRHDDRPVKNTIPTAFPRKSDLKNNAEAIRTINVVAPKKVPPKHPVASQNKKGHGQPTAAGKGQNHAAAKNNALEDHPAPEVSAIPDPVPDTGAHHAISGSSEAPHPSPVVRLPPATTDMTAPSNILPVPSTPSAFTVPVVSAPSLASYSSSSNTASISTTSASPRLGNVENTHGHSRSSSSHPMPVVAIVLIAVGSAFGLLALIIILRRCSRPRRRVHPTPSLPILQDDSPTYHDKGGDESPLFGGKDRFSRAESNTPWKWTQYQSGIPKPLPAANINDSMATIHGSRPDLRRHSSGFAPTQESSSMPSTADASIQLAQTATYAQPMTRLVPEDSGLRHKSRLSTMTMSAYTTTNHASPATQESIGLAVSSGGTTRGGYEGGHTIAKRASARRSVRGYDQRRSTIHGSPDALAYIASPQLAMPGSESDSAGFTGGRARVKAPYAAGSYMRTSGSTYGQRQASMATSVNPFEMDYTVPPLPPMPSDGVSAGDTRALTTALGLVPSSPPSPGATVYPDDSLSIVGERQAGREKKRANGGKQGSVRDTSDVLGNLMLSEYGGSMLSPEVGGAGRVRADDRPPRVPSPPVLPSLAQMALAHGHEEEFADYRSPTYSIYGLYEPDRKSRVEG